MSIRHFVMIPRQCFFLREEFKSNLMNFIASNSSVMDVTCALIVTKSRETERERSFGSVSQLEYVVISPLQDHEETSEKLRNVSIKYRFENELGMPSLVWGILHIINKKQKTKNDDCDIFCITYAWYTDMFISI